MFSFTYFMYDLWAINAIISNNKNQKIVYAVCSILWGICVVLDIAKLYIM